MPDDDITQVPAADVPDHGILVGGFPRQPFSIVGVSKKNSLGRATGFEDETQGTLFYDICRILAEKRPKAFFLENVKNLKSHDKGHTFEVIQSAIDELGWLRVNMGQDPKTGKYKVCTRRFNGTWSEAKKALREFTEEIEENNSLGRTTYTVQQWCNRYIERRTLNKEIAPSTARRIESNCKAACAHIGYANIAKVTPTMLGDMYIAMLKGETLSGKPSSGMHVHHIHNTLVLVFNQAVKEGILVSNPCDNANPPRNDVKEKHAIDPEKVREFAGMLDAGEDSCCSYMLALCMGMRRGEVCGLSWGDVDFERMTIYVHHSVDVLSNLRTTKTKSGTRLLPMSNFVAAVLHVLREFQEKRVAQLNKDRRQHGNAHGEQIELTDESPVIMNISGRRLNPTTLSKWWEDDRKDYGLEGVVLPRVAPHLSFDARPQWRASQGDAGARRALRPADNHADLHAR